MNYMPRVVISVPPDRDYQMTLMQTKLVYDQLLMDKYNKLTEVGINHNFRICWVGLYQYGSSHIEPFHTWLGSGSARIRIQAELSLSPATSVNILKLT